MEQESKSGKVIFLFLSHLLFSGGRGGGGQGASGGRGAPRTPTNRLFVKLSYETERETLESIFTDANDVYLPKDRDTGEQRG